MAKALDACHLVRSDYHVLVTPSTVKETPAEFKLNKCY